MKILASVLLFFSFVFWGQANAAGEHELSGDVSGIFVGGTKYGPKNAKKTYPWRVKIESNYAYAFTDYFEGGVSLSFDKVRSMDINYAAGVLIRFNFAGESLADKYFVDAVLGFADDGISESSSGSFGFGKRFKITENVSYIPNIGIAKVFEKQTPLTYYIHFLAFTWIF